MDLIIHFITSLGYPAIYLLMVMTAMMIPVPSEIILPFSGFMVQQGHFNYVLAVFVGALGDLTGAIIAYQIGFRLEERVVVNLIDNYGKYILFRKHEYERALRWFDKYGNGIVFAGRLVPGVRTFMSLPAGLAEMPFVKFVIYSFLGSLVWSILLTTIGYYLGKNWESIHTLFTKLELVIGVIIIAGIAYFVYNHIRKTKFPH